MCRWSFALNAQKQMHNTKRVQCDTTQKQLSKTLQFAIETGRKVLFLLFFFHAFRVSLFVTVCLKMDSNNDIIWLSLSFGLFNFSFHLSELVTDTDNIHGHCMGCVFRFLWIVVHRRSEQKIFQTMLSNTWKIISTASYASKTIFTRWEFDMTRKHTQLVMNNIAAMHFMIPS